MTDRSVRANATSARNGRAVSAAEQKTEAILNAARAVFSRHGFDATTVDAVAAEAGIAKGTVYLYFKSKEDLYAAALVRDVERVSRTAKQQMAEQQGIRSKLEAYLRVRLEFARSNEDFLRIYLAEQGAMFVKTGCKELRRIGRENLSYLASLIEDAQKAGEIRKLPAHAVAAAVGDLARGLMERRLLGWKEYQAEDEIEFALSLLWNGIAQGKKA